MRSLVGLILVLVGNLASHGQPVSPPPTFDVASLKAAPPANGQPIPFHMSGGPGTKEPARFTAENIRFQNMVRLAYDIQTYQLSGPDWIWTERYDLAAKLPATGTREQFRLMLQTLLAARLGLKVHWDTKEMPVHELVVAKSGPKLKESVAEDTNNADQVAQIPVGLDGFPALPPGKVSMFLMSPEGKAVRRAYQETMEQTAKDLSIQIQSPVVDATGLKGRYNFTLHWVTDNNGRPQAAATAPEFTDGPNLFQALQQQLGLKLESKRGPVRVLVVDRAEKTPPEN